MAAVTASVLALGILPVKAADNYAVHEWGTFTSVQGADGLQFEWNPFVTSDLPGFIYDRLKSMDEAGRLSLLLSKSSQLTLQRMETPVIYFYSDHALTLDVEVSFPQGTVTEWFPRASGFGPIASTNQNAVPRSFVSWQGVSVLGHSAVPGDDRTPPNDHNGSHYYAARETDANVLRTRTKGKIEHEKFLFYRGVGNFRAPLQASLQGNEGFLSLKNTGTEELRDLFVLQIRGKSGNRIFVKKLAPQEEQVVAVGGNAEIPRAELQSQIQEEMKAALTTEGLYPKEAAAMVATWNDSWFSENGLRVLYVLPRTWTDRVLPLKISEPPQNLVRVMVGRAEVITPSMEFSLLKSVIKYCATDIRTREEAVAEARQLELGRFLEPTVRRVLGKNPSREFSEQAWALANRVMAKPQVAEQGPLALPWTPGGAGGGN